MGHSLEHIKTQFYRHSEAFELTCGESIQELTLAYETYGELSENKDNAILLFHALTGSQHAAGFNPGVDGVGAMWTEECHVGWWDSFIGPGRCIDTQKFFVICVNYVGGCYGSTGPCSINPLTGERYGGSFPRISAADIVRSQMLVLDLLGIDQLHAVIGPSLGGLLCLTFAGLYPDRVKNVVSISSGYDVPLLQKLFTLEQIMAIESDADFHGGHYYDRGCRPDRGLCLARMISHKSFISLQFLENRARAEVRQFDDHFSWYVLTDAMESYMLHQGKKFVRRFDANTYLRIMDAWQRFDLLRSTNKSTLAEFFSACRNQHYLVFSIDSDVCFYPEQQSSLHQLLKDHNISSMHITVHSEKGHDSFLLEPELFAPHLSFVLAGNKNGHHVSAH